jgi:hypothetical protein
MMFHPNLFDGVEPNGGYDHRPKLREPMLTRDERIMLAGIIIGMISASLMFLLIAAL